jgi:hypothetical protein
MTATANPGHADVADTTVVHAAPAAANASAVPNSSTTRYYVCSFNPQNPARGGLGCIFAPGHGNIVGTRYVRNTTLNLVFQEHTAGFDWYELRFNGTNECLNWSPANGFVYEDRCIPNDHFEMWEHHAIEGDPNVLGNLASASILTTCQNRNSLLFALPTTGNCTVSASPQYNWQFTVA